MKSIDVLITGPMMPRIAQGVSAAFTAHSLIEAKDGDALLSEIGPKVRGIAAIGHSPHIDGAFLDRFPRLEIVANFGVGYDNVDAVEAGRRGIVVTNTPDVLTDEVADLTIGLLMSTVRQLPQAERYLRAGKWLEKPFPLSWTLRGRNVGIVGLGRIGRAIARRLEGFGAAISYYGRRQQPDVAYGYHASVKALAQAVDVLIVATPGGAETRHLIDAEVLRSLGPDGILINIARGSVVDEQALIAALREKTILSAGLDVFQDEPNVPAALIAMDHVVLLPHLGSASVHTRNAMGQLVVDNLTSWFSGKGPLTPVAETPWNGGKR